MLEVKLETEDSIVNEEGALENAGRSDMELSSVAVSCPPDPTTLPSSADSPTQSLPSDSDVPSSARFILPKPDSSDDREYNQQMRLKIASNLQPEFPLDPSCK